MKARAATVKLAQRVEWLPLLYVTRTICHMPEPETVTLYGVIPKVSPNDGEQS